MELGDAVVADSWMGRTSRWQPAVALPDGRPGKGGLASPRVRQREEPLLSLRERAALQETPWFTALPAVVRHDILRYSAVRRYASGQLLSGDTESCFSLNLVTLGAVRLAFSHVDAPALDYLPEGTWFVDPALFVGETPLYVGAAQGRTTIVSLPGDRLESLTAKYTCLHTALVRLNHERVVGFFAILDGLSTSSLQSRLARCLLRLAKNFGRQEGGEVRIALTLRQDEYAEMIRASRQRLNHALKELEAQGILHVRREMVVKNLSALQKIAGGGKP